MVFQNDAGMKGNIGKEGLFPGMRAVFEAAAADMVIFGRIPTVFLYYVMISVQHKKATLPVK